ncbi:molybdopterin biosynthesis protein [Halobacteriales archaeon QS_5_68_33]|nr:MAG: molybdopterin biosynthesis protein [Halobacteriales archaeon QS_5_68_33]
MSDRREFRELVSPDRAREVLDSLDVDPDSERVALEAARGRVLAERVDATVDVPGFDRASMDGYAVRARDTFGADEADPVALSLAGAVHAGEKPTASVGSGAAVEVSTGAVMPPGADAVVKVEETTETDDGVAVRTSVAPGDDVMLAGADVAAGARALGPGTRLTAREIGLLSALGVDEVPVRGKPRVGIVSTGDELVRPGGELDSDAGQIYDVNSYTIAAAVAEAGGDPRVYPHVGDDYDEMERLLVRGAEECDLVLSSGSTSASAVDVVYSVIEERGDLRLHGVAVKPGKPMIVGEVGESAYVGLPGYPVSALTIFRAFVAPVVREAAGLPEPETAVVTGRMAVRERYGEGRRRLMPAGLVADGDGDLLVYPVDKGSGATTSLTEADGIVTVPADTDYLAAGESVDVSLFSPEVRPPRVLCVGEDDPLLSRALDRVDRPRFLPVGTREGLRRLREGVPDVAVVAGPETPDGETVDLGGWTREWGLVVPEGNPASIEGVADLVDRDLRLVNRESGSGLRASFDAAVDALADDRDERGHDLTEAIDGYGLAARAYESPARKVAAGEADAGLGLRATATDLGLGFVALGTQTVDVVAAPDRADKEGVADLGRALDECESIAASLDGFEPR